LALGLVATALLLAAPERVAAAVIHIVDNTDPSNPVLTGAQNVDVDGSLFDVTFLDGTCFDLFSGCDSTSDFAFATTVDGLAAAGALLTQVLVDPPDASLPFDSSPSLTAGCSSVSTCFVLIPYLTFSPSQFRVRIVINSISGAADTSTNDIFDVSFDTDNVDSGDTYTFASFSPSAIPEPGTLLLLASGVAGLAVAGRRRGRR
jgi:hypothetical protein